MNSTAIAGTTARRRRVVPVRAAGKFLERGGEKLYLRGVTYGTFRAPAADAPGFPEPGVVESDLAQMAANGVNCLRTYTVPPTWLLDAAARHDLLVMVGLPWEQHVAFLDERERADSIEARVRAGVRACAGHPAVLAYAVGNEIPASIVRWSGRRRVERFLERLYTAAKEEDPERLVTYVNFPPTEYLQLPFLDLLCFNVYLERREALAAYLARLQTLAGECPLVMAEIGLDSRRNGEDAQAGVLAWQVETAFAAGCAGAFVFAWTDEWHRGGHDVEDWDFGLTDRSRAPKPALGAVREAFARVPIPRRARTRVSLVICAYNAERTLADCLDGVMALRYPDVEVIVVDDGSADGTAAIAAAYPSARLIRTPNRGLSAARNTGLDAAAGEIVAYLDSDARPDPHWVDYLVEGFAADDVAGVGGPNLPPAGDGAVADCVANAPGGPIHVLLSDREAEHIPGCNMAFRADRLRAVGGFQPKYRIAGDDVDLCWRISARGWKLGFSAAAVVWHHRRDSVRAYLRQQRQYGRAEALLERDWPEKYNGGGHVTWGGRIYGGGSTRPLALRRWRVYHGVWGTGFFQSLYERRPTTLGSLLLMPEWYLLVAMLAALAALGLLWAPLLAFLPPLAVASLAPVVQAAASARRASFPSGPASRTARAAMRVLTAGLHLLQPLARLVGRMEQGLTLLRQRSTARAALPLPRRTTVWREEWRAPEQRLRSIERRLRAAGARPRAGGECDRWDLEVWEGLLGGARMRMAVEEHGEGRQLLRFRSWPRVAPPAIVVTLAFALLTAAAQASGAHAAAVVLALMTAAVAGRTAAESAVSAGALAVALEPDEQRAAAEVVPETALVAETT